MAMSIQSEINIVRLTRGSEFVRFEVARPDDWQDVSAEELAQRCIVTLHNSKGEAGVITLAESRRRIENLRRAGWNVAAAR